LAAAHKAARERADAVSSAGSPGSQLRWCRVFAGQERELSTLRGWLRSLLPECPARDDVISVADELASNAIVHTASGRGGWFAVEVTWPGRLVRVAVADGGAPGGPRMVVDPAGEHGRGLVVVAAFSARTGMCGGPGGRLVWAEIAWDPGAAAPGPAEIGSRR
jgi:anti-sigma regulatory factor (Ser/Thr protein kinase)